MKGSKTNYDNTYEIIKEVYQVLEERRDNPIDSYTSKMMQDDDKAALDKILEKIDEETAEVIIAVDKEAGRLYFKNLAGIAYGNQLFVIIPEGLKIF